MVKWEYMRLLAEYDKRKKGWSVEGIDMMAYLNQLGQQGWEIVGYQDNTTFNQFGNITEEWKSFLMKRPMV